MSTTVIESTAQDGQRYDGAALNAQWGNGWPTTTDDATDPAHEHSPVLMAPVANLLGKPWYLESESPGGDFVIWLDVEADELRVGVSPHVGPEDGVVRWVIGTDTDMTESKHFWDCELPITESPETVVERVRRLLAEHDITIPTA